MTSSDLAARFAQVRARTAALSAHVSPEDAVLQSMPDASPTKWHLAHTTWFFEEFVLAAHDDGYARVHPRYGQLFNSYYESVGPRHARPKRGLLSRPSLDEVRAYREAVDARLARLLDDGALSPALCARVELGLHHEQQHQELLVTDLQHALFQNPLFPALADAPARAEARAAPLAFREFEAGVREVGHAGDGFAFDNEGPRHPVHVGAFQLAQRPVTVGEVQAFIDAGGYRDPLLWLSDGWAWVQREQVCAPLYWLDDDVVGPAHFSLYGLLPREACAPCAHLSLFEADAIARFFGARLPTEFEWEVASADANADANFADDDRHVPDVIVGADGLDGMFGGVWEHTQSAYAPYPGFRPAAGALGEYNGKFMVSQQVLRGGSCATPRDHIRATYRNFFYPHQRWQRTGVRLAKDSD